MFGIASAEETGNSSTNHDDIIKGLNDNKLAILQGSLEKE